MLEGAGHEVVITGRGSKPTMEEAAAECDLTIVSVPISVTEEVIRKVAPQVKALIDFTGVKEKPIEWMLKYSKKECEVSGFHPMYGLVDSIKGKTIIYCPTKKTNGKTQEIIECFKKEGAVIKEMNPKEHDLFVGSISQNARVALLDAYALLCESSGVSAEELYNLSSPPTQILLELVARQANEKNDVLYSDMRKADSNFAKIREDLLRSLRESLDERNPKKVRKFLGSFIEELKKRAERRVSF